MNASVAMSDYESIYDGIPTDVAELDGVDFEVMYNPSPPGNPLIKGKPCRLLDAPLLATHPRDRMPERPLRENSVTFDLVRNLSHLLPPTARRIGKRLLGLENPLT